MPVTDQRTEVHMPGTVGLHCQHQAAGNEEFSQKGMADGPELQ